MGTVEERLGLAEVTRVLEEVRYSARVMDAALKEVYRRYRLQMKKSLMELSDEEILADPEVLEFLMREDGSTSLYRRKGVILGRPLEGTSLKSGSGTDGRKDEYYGLPVLQGVFAYEQDVQAEVHAAEEWAKLFLFGRPDLSIHFMAADLSRSGSPGVDWNPSTGVAKVTFMRWSSEYVKYEGTLDGAFAYMAKHYWYEGGPYSDSDDD